MIKTTLPCYGITLSMSAIDFGSRGSIACSSDLYSTCSSCGGRNCLYQCDGSHIGEDVQGEEEVSGRLQYNGAVDGILSMILAHAVAGIDVESPAYLEGIETAMEAAGENL